MLCAFDLIELDGKDLRTQPIEGRKHALANLLFRERDGIIFNVHYDGDGAIIYRQACALGCEGIVSKRVVAPYRSRRTDHWLHVIRRQSLGEFIGRTLAGAALLRLAGHAHALHGPSRIRRNHCVGSKHAAPASQVCVAAKPLRKARWPMAPHKGRR